MPALYIQFSVKERASREECGRGACYIPRPQAMQDEVE